VDSALNVWTRRIGIALAFALIVAFLLPAALRFLVPLFGVAAWAGALFGYVCIFVGIPFLLSIVGKAAYDILFRPYVRARRIRVIRNQRMLREAAARQSSADS
jgi:hypothetical protein